MNMNTSQKKPRGTSDREKSFDRNMDKSRKSNRAYEQENVFATEVLEVRRVSCTTAGGRRMRFRASVVVGDQKGTIGFGIGKASEVPEAIGKAERQARKNLLRVPMYGSTIMHDCVGEFKATKLILKKAKRGTGFKTCNAVKQALSNVCGITDLVSKVYGSSNVNNIIMALKQAIQSLESPKRIALRRGKTVAEISPYGSEKTQDTKSEEASPQTLNSKE